MMVNGTISSLKYSINALRIYKIVVYSVVCLLGAPGNGLVIWFTTFRLEKSVNVVWFLNLAISDFTLALSLPLVITNLALDYHWPFGNFLCKFNWFVFFFNISLSVLQLMVISVDRCICAVFPVWCHNYRTKRLALIVVVIIWVISIALTLPSFIFRKTIVAKNIYCLVNTDIIWVPTVRFVVFFLVPLIVILSCYTVIVLRIKEKSFIKSSKPFKIIVVIVIAFFVCWFPYYLFVLLRIFGPNIKNNYNFFIGSEIASGLMLCNSCINPILYVVIGRDFKQTFCGSFQETFQKVFIEDMDKMNFKKHEQHSSSGLMVVDTSDSLKGLSHQDKAC
ncbi:chemerin-like receptor 1 [Rhinoderma darwinii]|uniref:chemerin-like receptor 1 n=1 Tax=Rhinoderma darwinii TaxID=43563 RepID=UPI003F66F6C3